MTIRIEDEEVQEGFYLWQVIQLKAGNTKEGYENENEYHNG